VIAEPRTSSIRTRLNLVHLAHAATDTYSAILAPLIGLLQVRCDLKPEQAAWLLGIGSLTSGLCQPVCAWLSDRLDSRVFGPIGLCMAAAAICLIGTADSFASLVPLYIIGMIGVGIFHPIGASSVGQLADSLPGGGASGRRSIGLSVFFVAGMVGGFLGSLLASAVAHAGETGFANLRYLIAPGIVVALILHLAIRNVPHRHHEHRAAKFDEDDLRERWTAIAMLYLGNAIRFTVNMAVIYLIVRWAESIAAGEAANGLTVEQVAQRGAALAGGVNASMVVGMAAGGLLASRLIPVGREKWPLVLLPIIMSPAIALFGMSGPPTAYFIAFLMGASFASLVPETLSVAQRLLPHRTSLASGLMLGAAWAVAAIGPRAAEGLLGERGLTINQTFAVTAILLGISGLICLPLRSNVLRRTAR
jgi:FSR family fosmidomycin resistance protein-like MFS transporter